MYLLLSILSVLSFIAFIYLLVERMTLKALVIYQADLLKEADKLIQQINSKNDQVLKFAILEILKQSIEKEDYETATKCKSILEQIK